MCEKPSYGIPANTKIDCYKIIQSLGTGCEGEAYKVREVYSKGYRVLKLFEAKEYKDQLVELCKKYEKFKDASGVVRYHHAGTWQGVVDHPKSKKSIELDMCYVVLEYFEGISLDKLPKIQPFRAIRIVNNVCEAIAECHNNDAACGDLHSGNILIDFRKSNHKNDDEVVKIIDFDLNNKAKKNEDIIFASQLIYKLTKSKLKSLPEVIDVLPYEERIIRHKYSNNILEMIKELDKLRGQYW